jgi:Ca2+-transporting ATPase
MRVSIFKLRFSTNLRLVGAVALSFGLQMAVIYAPFLQPVFKTQAMSLIDLGAIMVFSTLPLWIMEIVKVLNRRFRFYELY